MKKPIFSTISLLGISLLFSGTVLAQGMMGNTATVSDNHTAREEAEGKAVWEKLQAKELTCKDLSDDNFGSLGEYFMGQMMGTSHEAMNDMMIQMMGEPGEEQMHMVMGKRLSGCDTSAAFPSQGTGFMPMMQMMMGGWSSPSGFNQANNSMMNFGFLPFGGFGWVFLYLWWALIVVVIAVFIKWLASRSHGTHRREKSALEILQERYARGEIDKQEFEEKSRDIKNL